MWTCFSSSSEPILPKSSSSSSSGSISEVSLSSLPLSDYASVFFFTWPFYSGILSLESVTAVNYPSLSYVSRDAYFFT